MKRFKLEIDKKSLQKNLKKEERKKFERARKLDLQELATRIFNEEFKIINSAFKSVAGIKAFNTHENLLSRRSIYKSFRDETEIFLKIRKLAEKVTEKKLVMIDFGENQADQLKVRIKLREFFAPILLATVMQRVKSLLHRKPPHPNA